MHIHIMPQERIGSFVIDQMAAHVSVKPNAVLGMTTGNTPLTTGIFKELIRRENESELDLSRTVLINPDEQLGIPQEHPESYYTYMHKHLFDHLRRPAGEWYIPDGAASDPQAECDRMERAIHKHGGIDWQLMGIGINGHICFIEPQPAIPAACYVTPIAEVNRQLYAQYFGGILEAVPTHAITFGLGTVLRSRTICLVAVGEGKADIVAKALTHPVTTELPATILQMHDKVTVVLDEAAASKLPDGLAARPGDAYRITRHA